MKLLLQGSLLVVVAATWVACAGDTGSDGGQGGIGGYPTGGQATGGQATGGQATGGQATGGQATGGQATGGQATGGQATGGSGGVDCSCVVGAYVPVCGVDGATYDAACGRECVPVPIACDRACPCPSGDCTEDCTVRGLVCCGGRCANVQNDPTHCGACGNACGDATSFCNLGRCEAPPCSVTGCTDGQTCCQSECCGNGQLCCIQMVGPWLTACTDPVEGTCPVGCPECVCADPDTAIATPAGERPIADLKVGDLVYSVDRDAIVAVPILRAHRAAVHDHAVVHVELANGRTLDVSAPHPTADGRTFGELRPGQFLDDVPIVKAALKAYEHPYTHDILPASSSGVYFAAGVAIGSTLAAPRATATTTASSPRERRPSASSQASSPR